MISTTNYKGFLIKKADNFICLVNNKKESKRPVSLNELI